MNELKYQMSRSSNHMSGHKGASLFPSGLLMYDLPSLRRTASRASNNVELINRQSPSPRKRSPSPVPSVSHTRKNKRILFDLGSFSCKYKTNAINPLYIFLTAVSLFQDSRILKYHISG